MQINVKHTHGSRETFADLDSALSALEDIYGDEVVAVAADGWDLADADQLRIGRALVWRDEASSVDDDGARAVAAISISWK